MSDHIRLGTVLRVKHGFAFPGDSFSEDPSFPTLVTPGNFAIGGGFKTAKVKTFTGATMPPNYILKPGSLIVTMTDLSKDGATLGLPALVPDDGRVYLHNQRIGLIEITDSSKVDSRYLSYYLRTPSYRSQILGTASGSTVRHTSPSRIEAHVARLPSLAEQQEIGETLGALDNRIASNDKVSKIALELCRQLFMREDPGTMPHRRLNDLATVVLGGTPSRSNPAFWSEGTVPWISSSKANEDRILEPSEWITEEALSASAAKMMPEGATVLAITGATLGQVARLEIAAAGNQSLVGVWSDVRELNDWLYFAVREGLPALLQHSTGAAQQHINKAVVAGQEVPVPDSARLLKWASAAQPLLEVCAQKDRESIRIESARTNLLDLLMSGKLQFKAIEKAAEATL